MATSLRDIWQGNPWGAKLPHAIAVLLFFLEAVGIVREIGLAALNLTAIAFLFSMNRTLGEVNSSLSRIDSKL